MASIDLAVIGGSGLYQMEDLVNIEEIEISTPFGSPSDSITLGTLHGHRIAFLPRHGRGHVLTPTEVPYHANIFALKTLGVKYIIAVSACGSLQEAFAPGHVVIPDQLFDFTKKRKTSFFDEGMVAHISVAEPFSPELSQVLYHAVAESGGTVHQGGTFITIEGPRFSTKGESRVFRNWGMSIIGMTTSPEAYLAAEAEIAYACMAHITDYDVWHEEEEPVTVEMVIRTLMGNTALAQKSISRIVARMEQWAGDFAAHHALKDTLITEKSKIPVHKRTELALLVNKYLD
ncbi:MAG: S-methyl-5'-thioadenosine phosphorylase [Chloroflexi bacterium]|nr:MAG: S-methyl-5'-thioadenosine phosphorylase [Chloroflexota bacterium]